MGVPFVRVGVLLTCIEIVEIEPAHLRVSANIGWIRKGDIEL